MSTLRKITYGFVTQQWVDGKYVGQEFTAGDRVDFEDENGEAVDDGEEPEYKRFDMVQPEHKELQEFCVRLFHLLCDTSVGNEMGFDAWQDLRRNAVRLLGREV